MSRSRAGLLIVLGLVSLLPHAAATFPGRTYYFRDFGMAFYPFHEFFAGELAAGRWPFWNPYIQEGAFAFPMIYPPDLLRAFWRGPAAASWLLTLHYPLAALGAYALARELKTSRPGAFLSGAVYAMGGFAIASLNLYVFLQALALAPLVTFLLLRAAARGGRWIPAAGLCLGVALTTAQEFVAQAVLLGVVLAVGWSRRAGWRVVGALGASVILAVTLAAVPMSLVAGILPETVRGRGLPASMALDYSVHPAVFLQVFVRDLFGSVTSPLELWWGHRFFTKGFPYFTTLYLGPTALALACCGVGALAPRRRWLLLGLAALAVWYSLGTWGGLAPSVASWPIVRSFRFPSKALLLPYLVIAVLVARGADRLSRGRGWDLYTLTIGSLGALALTLALLAFVSPGTLGGWMGSDPQKDGVVGSLVGRDCLWTVVVASLGSGIALAVRYGRIPASRAALLVGMIVIADLVRAGTGVNPQTSPRFYELLPETAAARLDRLEGGRVFTYGTEASPAFTAFVKRRVAGGLMLAYFVKRQTLAPHAQLGHGIETVPADDIGAFVFTPPEIASWEYDPGLLDRILPRLRNSSVTRILSLDPLEHPEIRLLSVAPTGVPGLDLHLYELRASWPRAYVACRVRTVSGQNAAWGQVFVAGFDPAAEVALEREGVASCTSGHVQRVKSWPGYDEVEVILDGPGYLVTRDSYARGWKARVGDTEVEVLRANGKHRAVPLPAGRHRVTLRYVPPGLRTGLGLFALGVIATLALWLRPVLAAPVNARARAAAPSPAEP
jgi:hypothetical protein